MPSDGNYSIEATAPNGKSLIPSIVGHGAVIYGEFLLSKNETLKFSLDNKENQISLKVLVTINGTEVLADHLSAVTHTTQTQAF